MKAPSAPPWPPTTRRRPRSGCVRRSIASAPIPPSSLWPRVTSRPAATTSAPPTTIAPRSRPCPRSRPSTGSPTFSSTPRRTRRSIAPSPRPICKRLLDPDYEPFAKTTKLPPLPAYGPDPYNPAPVVLPRTQPTDIESCRASRRHFRPAPGSGARMAASASNETRCPRVALRCRIAAILRAAPPSGRSPRSSLRGHRRARARRFSASHASMRFGFGRPAVIQSSR